MTATRADVPETAAPPRARAWAAVVSVAFCSFSLVLSEFLPIGLLSDISAGLRVSSGTAGLLVVMPGLAAMVAAPVATLAAGRIDRKTVLVALAALIGLSNLLGAVSPGLGVMLAARLLLGVGVGGFWVFGSSVAPRLVDARGATRATATVTGGIALATVASLPLGALVGSLAGWRAAFALGAALAALALLAQLLLLPSLPPGAGQRVRDLVAIVRDGRSRTVLIACVATFAAQFAAYTYLEPYLRDDAGFGSSGVTLTLLGFGAAGLVGNFGFTRVLDAAPKRAVAVFMTLTAACVAVLPWAAGSPAAVVAAVAAWGGVLGRAPHQPPDLPDADRRGRGRGRPGGVRVDHPDRPRGGLSGRGPAGRLGRAHGDAVPGRGRRPARRRRGDGAGPTPRPGAAAGRKVPGGGMGVTARALTLRSSKEDRGARAETRRRAL
ncbi:MFS transporter [Streptomyces tremellae]|uniref:Major facilitator superfamily (MFS) profile domain-containing protein n=1 Tax=Streptomyces tremellae TaxID=1124239 RepID=A0ABP7DSZ0_9ACTN